MNEQARIHHGRFKYALSDAQVQQMRFEWESTRKLEDDDPNKPTYRTFMDRYKVGNNTVWKVLTYRSYTWVPRRLIDEA